MLEKEKNDIVDNMNAKLQKLKDEKNA